MQPLLTRTIGRTVLAVYPSTTSTLAEGRARKLGGYDPCYRVVAMACKSRESVTLAQFGTLDLAGEYVEAYSPEFGLITKG